MAEKERGLTYAQAGVDIDAGNRMVELIKPLVRATARPGADAEIGGFGGLFDLKRAGLYRPGPGRRHRRRRHQGQDRHRDRPPRHHRHRPGRHVGQRPGGARRRAAVLPRLLRLRQARRRKSAPPSSPAFRVGCREAGCALIGGETAEMPGVYQGDDYDLAGFAVGAAERGAAAAARRHRRGRRRSSALPPPACIPTAIRWCARWWKSRAAWTLPAPFDARAVRSARRSLRRRASM